jgi:tRNA modification GTPase
MQIYSEDIIAALATPAGEGAISVIRVSGENCAELVDKIFSGNKKLSDAKPNTIHYGKIIAQDNSVIDDVLVSVFKAPHSYTGEDSVEISVHGNPLIVEKVISELVDLGVRPAEPGEFSKRAFLNGRIDLAQAEAVAEIISARTEASLRGARNQLNGMLSEKVNLLRENLLNILSLEELELDFAEEDLEFIPNEEIISKIDFTIEEINKLLGSYNFGKILRDGINVAIVGKPNVGKSSLLNYLLKESRAIVSETPGTTRDVIREELKIDGYLFRLFDTAGIRTAEDYVEKEGVLRSREAIVKADLVLFINDSTTGFDKDIFESLLKIKDKNKIVVVSNKIDLSNSTKMDSDVFISAKTGEGINELFQILKNRAIDSKSYSEKTAIVSNIRHFSALKKANEALVSAKETINSGMSQEFVALDIREALESLNEIIGIVTTDDMLNNIFDKFCIGK